MPKVVTDHTPLLSFDTETNGLDLKHGCLPYFVTTCDEENNQKFWEFDVDPLTRKPVYNREDLAEIRITIKRQARIGRLVAHNLKFDVAALSVLPEWNIEPWPWEVSEDTTISSHLVCSNKPHNLTDQALIHLGINILPFEVAIEKATQEARRIARSKYPEWRIAREGLPEMPSAKPSANKKDNKLWKADMWLPRAIAQERNYPNDHPWWTVLQEYANPDSFACLHIHLAHMEIIKEKGLEAIYRERMRVVPVAFGMEDRGVTLSGVRLTKLVGDLKKESDTLNKTCTKIALRKGHILTLPKSGNNKSLLAFAFGKLNLPRIKVSKKTGEPSLDKEVITYYLKNLPDGSQRDFVVNLNYKRQTDTDLSYLESYKRYWVETKRREWFSLFSSINPIGTHTLRWSSERPNCVDSETEFLTRDGWVKADELNAEHEVAQFFKKTGNIRFIKPTKLHKHWFSGDLLKITTEEQIEMVLTPNHRCLLQNRRSGYFKDVLAENFQPDKKHLNAGNYPGGCVSLNEWEICWLCAVQADGSYKTSSGVFFAFKKKRKIERIRRCLRKLNTAYSERFDTKRKVTSFYVSNSERITRWAKNLMPEKVFGKWILDLDRPSLDKMCSEIFLWDGDATRNDTYSSSDKRNSDWVQILMSLSGNRANIASRMPGSAWSKRIHHYVNISLGRPYSLTSNFDKEEVPYEGYVYCVTVPSSYVVIRRNGKVSITGNSQNIGSQSEEEDEEKDRRGRISVRSCFGPAPGREWWSLDYNNLELRIPAYDCGEKELIDLFERSNEPPYYGSEHLLNFHTVYPDIWDDVVSKVGWDGAAEYIKTEYKSTWYRKCKAGDFAVGYGAVDLPGGGTADKAFGRPGSHARLKARFANKEKLNQSCIDHAEKYGYVETLIDNEVCPTRGYPIYCSKNDWGRVRPTVPLNYRVQSTACWVIMRAMIKVQEYLDTLRDGFLILQIHDELVLDFPFRENQGNKGKLLKVKRIMESIGDRINVPLLCGLSYHPNKWSEGVAVNA